MAKEYIERDVAKKAFNLHFGGVSHAVIANRLLDKIPAADVVEVFRPDEAVLAEFEDDYKDFEKIKTHLAQIIVEGKVEKPYYSILWWDEKSKEYNIGYSSYCLDYVRKWLELVFDVVEEADVVEVVRCRECKHFKACEEVEGATWTGFCNYGEIHTDEEDFCSRGERRC